VLLCFIDPRVRKIVMAVTNLFPSISNLWKRSPSTSLFPRVGGFGEVALARGYTVTYRASKFNLQGVRRDTRIPPKKRKVQATMAVQPES